MTDITWAPGIAISFDPDAIRDYTLDLIEWLEGDTIASATVTGVNCEATVRSSNATEVAYRISNVGRRASVTVHVDLASGQRDDFTVNLIPEHQ